MIHHTILRDPIFWSIILVGNTLNMVILADQAGAPNASPRLRVTSRIASALCGLTAGFAACALLFVTGILIV